ncbi:MAG: sigma-70 family RNA polymerase sigma factor [Planctomycetes bacterium]|nr:sigma-70 family RNA polymerase sigma factor [Planctomycetota bacterium]
MSDRDLLDAYLRGDPRAFEALVAREEERLLRYACVLVGDEDAARDVVQDTFLRLIREARRLEAIENLSAWLLRVCRNLAIDRVKKEARMRKREIEAAACEAGGCVPDPVETREVQTIVARELHALPANQREVLILKIQDGRSYREIGEITGLSTGNVGYLIHHGLRNLALRLKAAGIV